MVINIYYRINKAKGAGGIGEKKFLFEDIKIKRGYKYTKAREAKINVKLIREFK